MTERIYKDRPLLLILALLPISFGIFQLSGGGNGGTAFTRDCLNIFVFDVVVLFFYLPARMAVALKSSNSSQKKKNTVATLLALTLAIVLAIVLIVGITLYLIGGTGLGYG